MSTFTEYTAGVGDAQFDVPFPYLRTTDLDVRVDNVVATFTQVRSGLIELDTPCAGGESVTIQRLTDVAEPVVSFEDPLAVSTQDLNNAISQARHKTEELEFQINNIDGGGASTLPATSQADQFTISIPDGLGGFEWAAKTLAQTQAILGVGNVVPAPVAGNKFITTQSGSAAYQLSTIADVKALLGVPTVALPDPTGQIQKFVVSNGLGNGWTYIGSGDIASLIGLGTAAYKNAGSGANQVVLLDGTGKLPAVDGSQLTGIAPTNQYCRIVSSKASTQNLTSNGGYINPGAGLMSISVGPTGSAWCTTDGTSFTLKPGRYLVNIEQYVTATGSDLTSVPKFVPIVGKLGATGGTASPMNTYSPANDVLQYNDGNPGTGIVAGMTLTMTFGLDVTADATFQFTVAGFHANYAAVRVRHTTLPDNTNCPASTRIHIWKIN